MSSWLNPSWGHIGSVISVLAGSNQCLPHTKHRVDVQIRGIWVKQFGHQRLLSRSVDNDVKVRGRPM